MVTMIANQLKIIRSDSAINRRYLIIMSKGYSKIPLVYEQLSLFCNITYLFDFDVRPEL